MDRLIRFSDTLYSKNGLLTAMGLFLVFALLGYWLAPLVTSSEIERYMAQLYGSRLLLIVMLMLFIPTGLIQLKRFFNAKGSARQLALFRIIFFGFFFVGGIFYLPQLWRISNDFSALPASSLVDLPLMNWYPKVVPFNSTLISISTVLFGVSIIAGFIGYRPKIFILLFVLTGFYLFGIPNFYGKVNHNHHIIWIAAILAFSPCTHALSLDAYLARKKGIILNDISVSYGQPLRVIWLLIGIIYFFPGFWKMWSCGLDWALTDNVRNHLYMKWFELGDWQPLFHVEQYPFIYKTMGLFTLLFELFFIFLLFNKTTRTIGIVSGILFHLGTLFFMKIFFVVLLISYAAFLPIREAKTHEEVPIQTSLFKSWTMRIGWVLLIVNSIFGIGRIHSWPFSVYPTFDTLVPTETTQLLITVEYNHSSIEVDKEFLRETFQSERYRSLENEIINNIGTKKANELMLHLSKQIRENYQNENFKGITFWLSKSSFNSEVKSDTIAIYKYTI